MSALGYDYTDDEIKKILEEIDEDGSGVIEVDEFVEFMSKHMVSFCFIPARHLKSQKTSQESLSAF